MESGTVFNDAVARVRAGENLDQVIDDLVGDLTDEELLWLLDGDTDLIPGLLQIGRRYNATPFEAGRIDRLGIPGIRFTDGPRGVVMGQSTAFPAAIARAASWDVDLERRIGDAIGAEARAQGANLFAGVCVNLAPAPGWGRSQESYGEDPLLLGAMGAALVAGVNPWVMSCVKHYALNSMEEARFTVDVEVSDEVLHEVYLPHFRHIVESGVDAVMSAYNSVNGTWAGENRHLLTDVLRDLWGFQGFVMTDFVWGLRHPVESLAAGQEVEMPFRQQRARTLPTAARDGRLVRADVLRAARRLLGAQIRFALRAKDKPEEGVVGCAEHRALAREAAVAGTVLLRNEVVDGAAVLPLGDSGHVAVLGRLADRPNLGDVGSSQVFPPYTVSVLAGLRERLPGRIIEPADDGLAAAAQAARGAQAAVVVVGLDSRDEGEAFVTGDLDAIRLLGGWAANPVSGRLLAATLKLVGRVKRTGGDRRDLHLHGEDVEMIQAVAAVNRRTIVVVIGGGTVMLDPWDQQVAAILLAWYPGMEGGRAVADILLGEAEPGGRLPVVIPVRRSDLPEVDWRARKVRYPQWWGQRKLDHDRVAPAYPFGFGLGYTRMRVAGVRIVEAAQESFTAQVRVHNEGTRSGCHVVQLYAEQDGPPVLVGFSRIEVEPGATATTRVMGSLRPLQRWRDGSLVMPPGPVTVTAASFAGDPQGMPAVLPTT
jgi:beta-glucosidase